MELVKKIENLIKPLIEDLGYKIQKVEIKPQRKKQILEITIDKMGGVSVEDCTRVSRKIEGVLEKEKLFSGKWYLIVSSPGI